MIRKLLPALQALIFTVALAAGPAQASKPLMPEDQRARPVDLVIALDVSGSMSGLIESAKQRLWDIVNEIGQAQPQPDLRIAIITYGNPSYGEQGGYVRIDMPFTRDLDAVMQTLFGFTTNGGDEYVARAVQTAVRRLDWSSTPDAMRVLFIAGNEPATQDPLITVETATGAANAKGIVVNTLYCGSEGDAISAGWQNVATLTNGLFASINQDAAAVANIATPMDQKLAALNVALNETYVAYGSHGDSFKKNQLEQDRNAADMSMPSAASRAVVKASSFYRNDAWDLVDAAASGVAVEEMEPEALPVAMRDMQPDERKAYVDELAKKRESIAAEIAELGAERQVYIDAERARLADKDDNGLDAAILGGLRELAEKKGFRFDEAH